MTRRAGMRRWVRWGGVAAVVVIAGVWGASLFGYIDHPVASSGATLGIGAGTIGAYINIPVEELPAPGWRVAGYARVDRPQVAWLPQHEQRGPATYFSIPLWIPWILVAGFTAWRFRADRVKPPHACPSCGYDKAGLAAGAACPECGAGASS